MFNYDEQANEFLKKHSASIKIDFLEKNFYFNEDKQKRNIYKVTIRRNGKQYSHKFGDSLNNTEKNVLPTNYDVLASLQKYDICGDVWDFAREYGFEINGKESYNNVYKIYRACKREYKAVCRLFGDCIEELQEIE